MSSLVDIDSKGYGKIYKSVMRDRNLPLLAKTIYAYFCAYAGCGCQAFPKREKILNDLQINKDTFTKHLNLLVEGRYISKERTRTGNVYTILQRIPASEDCPKAEQGQSDMLVFENAAAHGFGTIPKLVMLDPQLTPQAKAIYAYFASFAGTGTTAFPHRTTIMRELRIASVETYYRHFNQLVEQGYLSVEQRKADGRFDYCVYRLHEEVLREGMSEKPIHGGKFPSNRPAVSEKAMSEKLVSEKLEHQNFGQADIKNRVISNSSLENEQEYNHQSDSVFTPEMVKEIIHFDQLQAEVRAWGDILRDTLNSFSSPEEEQRYQQTLDAILQEIVTQATIELNRTQGQEEFLEKLSSPALLQMICRLLIHWKEVQNVQAYVSTSLRNL
ncbi:MAG: hypothetical protein HFF10_05575 [Angelakisella sp.]|nr:hypothetical protein [Angelakisella sp.]